MKTSIIIPDGLHRQVADLAPDVSFGELVRDALLIAMPTWEKEHVQGPVVAEMARRLRTAEANASPAAVGRVRSWTPPRAPQSPPAPAKRAPATPPARPKAGGKRSATKAAAAGDPPAKRSPTRARSRRS